MRLLVDTEPLLWWLAGGERMQPNATAAMAYAGQSGRDQRRHRLGDRALAGRGPGRDPGRVARPRRRARVPHADRHGGARGTGRSARPRRAATTSTACWSPRRSSRASRSSPATPSSPASRCRPSRCSIAPMERTVRDRRDPGRARRPRPRGERREGLRAARRRRRAGGGPGRAAPSASSRSTRPARWAGGIVGDGDAGVGDLGADVGELGRRSTARRSPAWSPSAASAT